MTPTHHDGDQSSPRPERDATPDRTAETLDARLRSDADTVPLQRATRRARRRRRTRRIVVGGTVTAIALAAGGVGIWSLLDADGAPAPAGSAAVDDSSVSALDEAAPQSQPLTSRDADADPLTPDDLFDGDVLSPEGAADYQILGTDSLEDCVDAGVDEVAELLGSLDCTEVVRATVASPDQDYLATVGAVNLPDVETTEELRTQLESGVDGGFTALRAGGSSQGLGLSPTVLGFNAYSHFLLYAVVGREDGESASESDDEVAKVVTDVVDVYLVDQLTRHQAG